MKSIFKNHENKGGEELKNNFKILTLTNIMSLLVGSC